jgi:hypothetical protein
MARPEPQRSHQPGLKQREDARLPEAIATRGSAPASVLRFAEALGRLIGRHLAKAEDSTGAGKSPPTSAGHPG